MLWFSLIIFIVVCYGASNQVVFTSGPLRIYDGIKWLGGKIHPSIYHMLTCMICLPTWFGLGLSALDLWVVTDLVFTPGNILLGGSYWWLAMVIDGAIASGSTWFINTVQAWFETNIPIVEEENKSIEVIDKRKILND